MNSYSSNYFEYKHDSKQYKLHYLSWGNEQNPVLICAHGLTRNAHDFDFLAHELSNQYRIIAIDYPGRGSSDWLENKQDYIIATYVNLSLALLAHLKLTSVNWLGTSMGGLIGIIVSALSASPITKLLINDVGPALPENAIRRIAGYLMTSSNFKNLADFEQHLRKVYAPFGILSDKQWTHLATHSHRLNSNEKIQFNYDPGIGSAFQNISAEVGDLWHLWPSLTQSICLLHGGKSDILTAEIVEQMIVQQPGMKYKMLENIGHAPALMNNEQITLIRHWLQT